MQLDPEQTMMLGFLASCLKGQETENAQDSDLSVGQLWWFIFEPYVVISGVTLKGSEDQMGYQGWDPSWPCTRQVSYPLYSLAL